VSTTVQSLVIVGLGWLGVLAIPGGFTGLAILIVASVLLGTVSSAFSNTIGMLVRRRQTIYGPQWTVVLTRGISEISLIWLRDLGGSDIASDVKSSKIRRYAARQAAQLPPHLA
jgi:hypothetical protein